MAILNLTPEELYEEAPTVIVDGKGIGKLSKIEEHSKQGESETNLFIQGLKVEKYVITLMEKPS